MPKTVLEVLTAGKALILDPQRWTQGFAARDKNGWAISPYKEEAVCFCSLGAVWLAANSLHSSVESQASCLLDSVCPPVRTGGLRPMAKFNDTHTHEEVLKKWDEAIQIAEKAQLEESQA